MAPKKEMDPDLKKGDVIQAVVIADPFNTKFAPLTTPSRPKCMLPLANRPILAYTLDFLKGSGVQEVILYCTDFALEIRKYLAGEVGTWGEMVITTIGNEDCRSLGDAMRDLDAKGLLRSDFILISTGDTISNVNLLPILEQHKKQCQIDKNATMTLVYKKASPGHHCRSLEEELIVAASPQGQLLHHARAVAKNLNFPLEIFVENDSVDLRFDLLETGIAICSQEVPPLFSDNFDCQTLDEFVKGTLQNDLTDHTIYVHAIEDESYAARIHNMLGYMAVTRDVLHRWLFPIVPDIGLKENGYTYARHNVYKATDLVIKRKSVLEEDVIVGPGSRIGENTTVCSATIGHNCNIGNNVSLKNCIIHDDVTIEDNCRLEGCVIASNVRLDKNVEVGPKSVLGPGVHIKPGAVVPPETRLVSTKHDDGFSDDDDDGDVGKSESEYGPSAFPYLSDDEDLDSDASEDGPLEDVDPWGVSIQSTNEDDSSSSDDGSDISGIEDMMPDIMLDEDAKYNVFFGEVLESLQRGAKEGVNADNLSLEVNSSRHAYAVTPNQVIQSVYVSIVTIAAAQDGVADNSAKLLASSKKHLGQFKCLVAKYVKSSQAQENCLESIGNHATSNPQFMPIVMKIVHYLYDEDILTEDAIISWYGGVSGPLKDKLKPLIVWLQEADSGSEDDDDDEDSD